MSGKKTKHTVTLAEALRTVSTTLKVQTEVGRQEEQWGLKSWQDGTGPAEHVLAAFAGWMYAGAQELANVARNEADALEANGQVTWLDLLLEEVLESAAERPDLDNRELDRELTQVAAVCVSWLKDRERRRTQAAGQSEPAELDLPVTGIETTVSVDVRTEVVGEEEIEDEVVDVGDAHYQDLGSGGPEPVRDWTGQDADEVS